MVHLLLEVNQLNPTPNQLEKGTTSTTVPWWR
jgi:hypothetical protein